MTARLVLRTLPFFLVVGLLASSQSTAAADEGEDLFKKVCVACHYVNADGKTLVGPDLGGVTKKRSQPWLESFIKDSMAMVNAGDPDAVAIYEQFNKVPMPPPGFNASQVRKVIDYLATEPKVKPAAPMAAASPEDVEQGKDLFQGLIRFENRGPACNACHDVRNDAIIGGGILAKDLTTILSDAGGTEAIRAKLGAPPHPVMQRAYEDHALTEDEIFALVAFLQDADANHALSAPRDYGLQLFLAGGGGFIGLMVIYGLLWMRRKKRSVNHDIFERQVRSE